ncbi:hypothetical protein F4778DRAFT_771743 [Xylariomycetidae sp. FL2044]|nr:hypothetical protein F4778DRAFT_771743 [Xylariomycetidae sp. FL2044]
MSFQKRDMSNARGMGSNSGKADGKANGASPGFRTDSAIGSSRPGRERPLQPWVPPSNSDGVDMSLEKASGAGGWDQFAANANLFGVKSTYDENIYTTPLDRSDPQYKERMAKADRTAREIERSAAGTAHVAEERVMDYAGGDDKGGDEEDKYSGVKRSDFPPLPGNKENKYMPPAKRGQGNANAVAKNAPMDPAIISSQLKTTKPQAAPKGEETKPKAANKAEASTASSPMPAPDSKPESKGDSQQKRIESKDSAPLKPLAAANRTVSPQAKDGQAGTPSATSTVERDVLKEFKSFASQQRMNAEKARSNKARQDKEVRLTELKKFATNFKLPTPVPVDLISIIAKDPAKQREIQEKAQRDAQEVAKRKADEAAAKEKKASTTKETQPSVLAQPSSDSKASRPTVNAPTSGPAPAPPRHQHQSGRQSFVPPVYPYQNNRPPPQHNQQGRQGGLTGRIRAMENQKAQEILRMPPTGPANPSDPSYTRRMAGPMQHHLGKLNPHSNEFKPAGGFAQSFGPNGHPSAGSSPRSAMNHSSDAHSGAASANAAPVVVSKKRKTIDPQKCSIMSFARTIQPPETKNWNDNDGFRPSFDTPPTWRSALDDETADSTMRLTYDEYFERQPFNSQPTPNPPNLLPNMAHAHQLPLHLQPGSHSVGPRHSPHVPPVAMHGHHGAVQHTPFNGGDDHRMMHSNSQQSFSSPRMGQVPVAYPPAVNAAGQMHYGQPMVPFMGPSAPPMNFARSFSNNNQYMPQQPGVMNGQMIVQPPYMTPQGMMPAGPPQMPVYAPGHHHQYMPPGGTPPSGMSGANGYPSPGRPAAPMMAHQGSQQGQAVYSSPAMAHQQPYAQNPSKYPVGGGSLKKKKKHTNKTKNKTNLSQVSMRPYNNNGPQQQYGTSPQQMHQYAPQHRNGNNYKHYQGHNQGHNQHQGPQGGHGIPTGPQGRSSDGHDEAK